jgi:hypothetical protein
VKLTRETHILQIHLNPAFAQTLVRKYYVHTRSHIIQCKKITKSSYASTVQVRFAFVQALYRFEAILGGVGDSTVGLRSGANVLG